MPRVSKYDPLLATRQSLIARLTNWDDQLKWQEFFETYWLLIHSVAIRAGLRDDEAQEVVQETCIAVAKNIARYDPKLGKFKGWLLQTTHWRVVDQFRKRAKARHKFPVDSRRSAMMDQLEGEGAAEFQKVWDEEWEKHVLDAALARLKRKVDAKHYQIFDCALRKGWDGPKIAKMLNMSVAQVYVVNHRLKRMLQEEVERLGQ